MKKSSIKRKKQKPENRKVLNLEQLEILKERRIASNYSQSLLNKIKNKSAPLNIHGLALVRFLMHLHPTKSPFNLESTTFHYVSSSLGVVDSRVLFDLAYAFIPGFAYESRHLSDELGQLLKNMFRVVFPSKKHVTNSALGPKNANSLFLDHVGYTSRKFEKSVMAKFEANGLLKSKTNVIPHLKIAIISNDNGNINDDTIIYLGSHNMTKAAWGRFSGLGNQLFLSNYEMGVIVPPREGSAYKKADLIQKLGFKYPADRFEKNEYPFTRGGSHGM